MTRITVPAGPEPMSRRVWRLRPELGVVAEPMADAAFERSVLPRRLREVVRMRIAQINGCMVCLGFRDPAGEAEGLTEELYAAVGDAHRQEVFSPAERLAVEYAERFALDWDDIDDELFDRLREHFDDAEIVDLTFCIARHLAFGRMTRVLGLDREC